MVRPHALARALGRLVRDERGSLGADWAFITVGGGVMAIIATGAMVAANGGMSSTMRAEVGAPEPEEVLDFATLEVIGAQDRELVPIGPTNGEGGEGGSGEGSGGEGADGDGSGDNDNEDGGDNDNDNDGGDNDNDDGGNNDNDNDNDGGDNDNDNDGGDNDNDN